MAGLDKEANLDKEADRTFVFVNRTTFKLKLYKRKKGENKFKIVATYPISPGMRGLDTPEGVYYIDSRGKNVDWKMPDSDWVSPELRGTIVKGGTPENPIKARWLGIYDGAGIHGVDPSEYESIGKAAASHGCIRMKIPDVKELYDRVPLGTLIHIV